MQATAWTVRTSASSTKLSLSNRPTRLWTNLTQSHSSNKFNTIVSNQYPFVTVVIIDKTQKLAATEGFTTVDWLKKKLTSLGEPIQIKRKDIKGAQNMDVSELTLNYDQASKC